MGIKFQYRKRQVLLQPDVNYATINGTYKVYFSRGNKYLDGIEISVVATLSLYYKGGD